MYTIDFDPRTRLMTMTGEGLWTMATLAAFSTEVLARGTAIRVRHGQFAVLNDVRKMPVQLPQVARGLEVLMAQGAKITSAPMAIIASGMLPKLQIERVLKAPNTRTFLSMSEAERWLADNWPARTTG